MKVIVDDKIPYIKGQIEQYADEVVYLPGRLFTPEVVRDADALFIRTRTDCSRELLVDSRVRFIATATIGFDHIDTSFCREAGIVWANAPGCNAASVAQYVHNSLLLLELKRGLCLSECCMGIVGVGHVGSQIEQVAKGLGMKVLRCDPPRARVEGEAGFVSLDTIARQCDIITFHTPLIREGEDRTYHLADEIFFHSLQRCPVLLNTSRGEVVNTEALVGAWHAGKLREMILDVWEHEPDINRYLLSKAFLATPHIAGYSADGKANATRMSLASFCRFFGLDPHFKVEAPTPENPIIYADTLKEAFLQMYNPERDSEALKQHPDTFEALRGNYPLRREEKAYRIVLE